MGKMNIALVCFAAVITVTVSSPVVKQEPKKTRVDPCTAEPIVYCSSPVLRKQCGKEEFCISQPGKEVVSERIDTMKYYWDPLLGATPSEYDREFKAISE